MESKTDDELAQIIHDALNEAESRAEDRGKTRIARLLKIGHRCLHAAGVECVEDDDIDVSPMSIGGDKD